MPTAWLQKTLTNLYEEALDSLDVAISACPDELWAASMWEVRLTDRHVWPIVRGMGEDLPDEERLQLHSAFGNIAYHVLFFLDHYLSGGVGPPDPPPPFRGDEQEPHTLPHRMYTRDELLEYLGFCRRKAESVLAGLTEEQLERPARIGWPLGDLLIRNVIQVTDHAAQLSLFLNRAAGWSDPRWTTSDRWFRRCPDCPGEGA